MGNGSSTPITFPPTEPESDLGVINNYSLVRRLGKGSYGKVYECRKGGVSYAMKVQTYSSAQELDFIVKEIEQLSKIAHPNIIRYITTFPWTLAKKSGNIEVVCIVTDLVRGASMEAILRALARSNQMVPPEVRAKWTVQLVSTVAYLHLQGKVHRDLKPANVLVDGETLDLVVIDFGAARDLDEEGHAHTIIGTPFYMAPELRTPFRQPYSDSVDVWSVGMILIEVLAGIRIDTALLKLTEKVQWEGALMKKLAAGKVPQVLTEILVSMLRTDPAQRLRLRDLEQSSLYRGYRLCYGLVDESLVDDEVFYLVSSSTNFSSLLIAVESQPESVVRWAISIAKSNINVIPPETYHNPKVIAIVQSLAQHHPEAKDLLTMMDKKRRRSRVNSGDIPLPEVPPSTKSKGWSVRRELLGSRGRTLGRPAARAGSGSAPSGSAPSGSGRAPSGWALLTKTSSQTLDAIQALSLDPTRVEGVVCRLSVFEISSSDALESGLVLVDLFSSMAPRAMDVSTEVWYQLSRRGSAPSAPPDLSPARKWSMLHIDEWVELDPDYHPILSAVYAIEGVEGVVLKKRGKISRIANLRHATIRSLRGNPSPLRPE